MLEEVIKKLQDEMAKEEKNPFVQLIGQFLLGHLELHPEHAEQVVAEEKTIAKSLDAMKRYAQKRQVGGMAMVSDQDGYNIVLQYFGCYDGEPYDIPAELEHKAYTPPARQTTTNHVGKSAVTSKGKKTPPADQLSLFDEEEEGAGCEC